MPLDLDAARKLVTPIYDALTRPGDKDVEALIKSVTSPDFQSCGNEGECADQAAVITRFTALASVVPNRLDPSGLRSAAELLRRPLTGRVVVLRDIEAPQRGWRPEDREGIGGQRRCHRHCQEDCAHRLHGLQTFACSPYAIACPEPSTAPGNLPEWPPSPRP